MSLEAGTLIPELNQNNPLGSDPKSEGDDHLRLVKRCVQGSFAAFVGTTAIPKSVSLTEDQINDAALKSEAQTISGLWNFTGADTRFAGNITLEPINSALQTRNFADTADIPFFVRSSSSDVAVVGNAAFEALQYFGGNNSAHRFFSNGLEGFRCEVPADGGAKVSDIGGTFKKVGFRNPTDNQQNVNYTLSQSDEQTLVRHVSSAGGIVFTVPVLEAGTSILIINDDTNDFLTLREGSGVSMSALTGGAQLSAAPDLFLADDSICQLMWMSNGTTVKVWGNGLSN